MCHSVSPTGQFPTLAYSFGQREGVLAKESRVMGRDGTADAKLVNSMGSRSKGMQAGQETADAR